MRSVTDMLALNMLLRRISGRERRRLPRNPGRTCRPHPEVGMHSAADMLALNKLPRRISGRGRRRPSRNQGKTCRPHVPSTS